MTEAVKQLHQHLNICTPRYICQMERFTYHVCECGRMIYDETYEHERRYSGNWKKCWDQLATYHVQVKEFAQKYPSVFKLVLTVHTFNDMPKDLCI